MSVKPNWSPPSSNICAVWRWYERRRLRVEERENAPHPAVSLFRRRFSCSCLTQIVEPHESAREHAALKITPSRSLQLAVLSPATFCSRRLPLSLSLSPSRSRLLSRSPLTFLRSFLLSSAPSLNLISSLLPGLSSSSASYFSPRKILPAKAALTLNSGESATDDRRRVVSCFSPSRAYRNRLWYLWTFPTPKLLLDSLALQLSSSFIFSPLIAFSRSVNLRL